MFFNSILLNFRFEDLGYVLNVLILFSFQWVFFFKNNFFTNRVKTLTNEKHQMAALIKKLHYKIYIKWLILSFSLLFLSFFIFTGVQTTCWWDHLKLTNFNIYLVMFLICVFLVMLFLISAIPTTNLTYNIDFFFCIGNLVFLLLLIFFANNVYTFFFLLELSSNLVFYKFAVSKSWFIKPHETFSTNFVKFNRVLPTNYVNMLFFQYWSTFFSSILLLYSITNIVYLYGSFDWLLIEYLVRVDLTILYHSNFLFFCWVWFAFFFGLFLKIGLTPLHLFKIEVYKGLPFISIFFYTIFYFLVFFLFIVILILNYLNTVVTCLWIMLVILIIFGGIYTAILFFSVSFLKAFFAYSTVLNVYSLFCAIVVML